MAMNLGSRLIQACPVGDRVRAWLDLLRTTVAGCREVAVELIADHATAKTALDGVEALVEELHDDHAAFKTVVDELKAWAETLGAKLNADAGVTDEDYDAVIAADAPDTLAAGKPGSGPATLTAGNPDAAPAALATFE